MEISLILHQLGLSKKEAQVYLATLELGMAPASVIARKVQMQRTSATEILLRLCEKGIAEFFLKKRTRYYSVISPKSLLDKYQEHVYELEGALPQLLAISNEIVNKPRITFYEGKSDLRRIYMDTLTASGNILNYFLAEKCFEYFGGNWMQDVIQKRIKKGITIRAIVPNTPLGTQLADKEMRVVRAVPQQTFFFTNEIYIYNNKVLMFSYENESAIMIESSDAAQTQRAIFELAWLGATAVSA